MKGSSDYLQQHLEAFTLITVNISEQNTLPAIAPALHTKGIAVLLAIDPLRISWERYAVSNISLSY